jgi:type IV pilus assembly protein PilQ
MRCPYNRFYSVIRNWVPIGCLFFLGWAFSACSVLQPPAPAQESRVHRIDAMEAVIEQASALMDSSQYERAAELLRSVGKKEPSYYRMDEVIFLLARCNLALGDPVKANRCFELLREYYPRAESRFPLLIKWEERTAAALAALKDTQRSSGDLVGGHSSAAPVYSGPLVSNAFYETDIRQALMDLSTQTGIPIIPDAMVRGYVTLDIQDVPLEQALTLLLAPMGYSFRKIEDHYIVGAPTKDNPSFPLLVQTKKLEPKNIPAADVLNLIPDYYNDFLKVDARSNTLIISAPPEIIKRFEEELDAVDKPPQQVMIEALVVEMGDEARRSLGLEWDWTGTKANDTFTISKLLPSYSDTAFFLGQMLRTGDHVEGLVFDLRLALQALAIQDKANIRANPRVSTLDGQEATVRIGKEAYYSLLQGSTVYSYVTLEKISTGITLMITPYVGKSGKITADISIEVSDVTGSGATDLPVTSVRSVDTRIQIANGETVGIGGLISENKREERHRVPFLGDIPIIGYLFGNTTTSTEETEVVVLITPHLLIDPGEFDRL